MRSRSYVVWIFAPVLVYLAVLLLVAALVVKPPALGWIGFGVAGTIGLAIAGLASILFPRTRVNAERRHPRRDGLLRLLVVADAHCDRAALCAAVQHAAGVRPLEVFVVAPVLARPAHFLADAEEREREDAQVRLAEALRALTQLGIEARGLVGTDDPLQAIGDGLAAFAADEILLVPSAGARRPWLEQGLERRARDTFGVHVSTGDGAAATAARPAA